MAKSKKKRWLAKMRAQRWFELVMTGVDAHRNPHFQRVPITEARGLVMSVAASKAKLLSGAHNSMLQYNSGAKPLLYSYTSGCRCIHCQPKEWTWRTWADGYKSLESLMVYVRREPEANLNPKRA